LDQKYSRLDIATESLTQMVAECAAFQEANSELLASWPPSADYAGHDFWLTRNGHGAGYWARYGSGERELEAIGAKLSEAAHACGEKSLYAGDDGLIYQA
jgi:hypothetical protein